MRGQGTPAPQASSRERWRGEQADVDGGAGAGERQERHREVRVLDREPERGAQLVAVERAVACPAHPSRRKQRPAFAVIGGAAGIAGAVAPKADAARTEKFGLPRRVEAAEAEALVGERHRTVRIAVARRDGVAEPGDQEIAHGDVLHGAADRLAGDRDVDGRRGGAAVAGAKRHRRRAVGIDDARLGVAVGEAPGAGGAGRDLAGRPHLDAMVGGREIIFAHAVAGALVDDLADRVEA